MLSIETKKINISEELMKKVNMICKFANAKADFSNGSIRNIKGTNIAYVEPHQLKIKGVTYLIFEETNRVFVNNLYTEISMSDLEKCIKKTHVSKHKAN